MRSTLKEIRFEKAMPNKPLLELNDYELIYMAHQKDDDSYRLMIKKYTPVIAHLIFQKINSRQRKFLFEDIFQEASAMLVNAVDSYRDDSNTRFFTFSIMCIERRITDIIRKMQRGTYMSVSEFSLDAPLDRYTVSNYGDVLEDPHYEYRPEEYSKEVFLKEQLLAAADKLGDKERKIYLYQSLGYNYIQIAELTGASRKNVEYLLRKAKDKIKNELKRKEKC